MKLCRWKYWKEWKWLISIPHCWQPHCHFISNLLSCVHQHRAVQHQSKQSIASFSFSIWASRCYALPVTIKYFYVFFLFSIVHHYFYVSVKLNLDQYTFHGHEKTHVKFFSSYPCWWIGKKSEIVIKWR
jgi:hypothetical protein